MGKHSSPKQDCRSCSGSGKQRLSTDGGWTDVNCVICNGTGKV